MSEQGATRLLKARGLWGRVLVVDPPDAAALAELRNSPAVPPRDASHDANRSTPTTVEPWAFDVRKAGFATLWGAADTREHAAFDVALVYLPKGKARQRWVLDLCAAALRPGAELRVAGGRREGIRSIRSAIAERFDATLEVQSGGHAQCVVARGPRAPAQGSLVEGLAAYVSEASLPVPGSPMVCVWYPGVYGADKLDEGSELLLSALASQVDAGAFRATRRVLDVGCGCGVLGAWLARASLAAPALMAAETPAQGDHPSRGTSIHMVDVDALALSAARATLERNGLAGAQVSVWGSDVYSAVGERYDWIVSNPPFHEGARTSYDVAERLIREAPARLAPGGRLTLVANAFLPYRDALDQTFGSHRVLAETARFRVYQARARA